MLAADGSEPVPRSTPEEFKVKFEKEYRELERIVKAANIKFN
jgi:hypothetical protein